MPLPAGFPAEDASFAGIAFWELFPDGRGAAVGSDQERVTVGQTVITRYKKAGEIQVLGLCGLDEASDFDSYDSGSDVLGWHRGNESVLLVHVETKRIPQHSVAEVTLTVILL
jgi:hypothetical protein